MEMSFYEKEPAPYKPHQPTIHIKWSNDPEFRAIQQAAYNFHQKLIVKYQRQRWDPKFAKRARSV